MNTEAGQKLLRRAVDVMKETGVYERSFIGFGTLLGAVRPSLNTDKPTPYYRRGMIPWDHDMDMCFLPLPREKKEEYFAACKEASLFKWKPPHTPAGRQARKPDGEILWLSLKLGKMRMCNWFCIDFQGNMFHSKGRRWLVKFDKKKYGHTPDHQAILKGTPSVYYENLMEIEFEGVRVNAPVMSGSLLDLWYPGWSVPRRGGASAKKTVCVVKNWGNEKTWRVM